MKIIKKFLAVISSAVICAVASIPITSSAFGVEPVEGSFESIISELGDNTFVTTFNNLTQTYMFAITEETEADYKLLYTVEQDGTATITGYEGVVDTLVIPSEIDGYPVSKIDVQAFATSGEELYNDENSYCSVETLIIEEGVTEIELEAFLNCKNLKSVTLPNTLDYVWDMAFCGCDSLKEIKIPSGTGRICEAAFGYKYECNYVDGVYDYEAWTEKMDDFTIYGEVDSIAETYANENGFTFIALDDTSSGSISNLLTWEMSSDYNTMLVTVGDDCTMTFEDGICNVDGTVIETTSSWNIEELDTEENQEFIEWLSEFELNEIIFSDNVTEIIDTFNIYLFNQAEKITFGENVAIIGDGVFYSSEASEIVFPDSLIEIGDNAFENCTNLSSIILPKNINSVGESAFHACSSLLDVTVLSQNADLADHCFGYSNQIEPLENMIIRGYAGSTAEIYANENGFTFIALDDTSSGTISNLLTWEISSDYNTMLVTVGDDCTMTFEDGICNVDGDIIDFDILDGLLDETIEESEDFIFLSEWMNNYQVNQIVFSDNIKRIDTQLFSTWFFNNALQITFGNQLEYIAHDAFVNYEKIDTIILPASLQQVEENAFSNCENLIDITILSHDVILNDSGIGYYSGEKLDDVTIRGYQNSTAETYANENGFTFIALDDVTTETTTFTLGDVDENNVIDAIDASYVLSEYAKKATAQVSGFTESQELAADVNGDSVVDAVDASFILSYYAYTAVGGADSFEDYMTTH